MTTAEAPHAPAGGLTRAWRGFRRWRRSRPFWGGLLTALAGVEMFASTKMTINGLSFASGATGLYSLLIPVILLTCGLLLWLSPGQRLFYSIVAAVTTVYSLMGLNLGGFFVGLLLGLVGSALGFAWTPTGPAATDPAAGRTVAGDTPYRHDEPSAEEQALVDDLLPAGDPTLPRDRAGHSPAGGAPAPRSAAPASDDADPPAGSRNPGWFAVVLLVLGLAVSGFVTLRPSAGHAAPAMAAAPAVPAPTGTAPAGTAPTGTACATPPARPATPTPSPSRSVSGSPSPTPSPEPAGDGNIVTDFFRGIGDLFTGGRRAEPSATPSTGPTPGAKPPTAKVTPGPTPTRRGSSTCAPAKPDRSDTVEPGRLMPRIAPEPGQPKVAERPSELTGSKVTMTGLRFEGIVDLPTANGTLKALKFSMAKAVTDDFKLVADGPAGRRQQYVTDRLTVQGDVAFYAARFSGKLLGIRITLTPDLPFPDGLPITSPIPITFTDPRIDLAFVDSDTLTARPALRLSVP